VWVDVVLIYALKVKILKKTTQQHPEAVSAVLTNQDTARIFCPNIYDPLPEEPVLAFLVQVFANLPGFRLVYN